jgi:hypothetical protein
MSRGKHAKDGTDNQARLRLDLPRAYKRDLEISVPYLFFVIEIQR